MTRFKTQKFSRLLLEWYRAHKRDLPWRKTSDPYAILVSEIMLQQTQVKTVIPYYQRWMRRFPTTAALARAEMDQVLKMWEGLGYYRRARFLHEAARVIQKKWKGRFPSDPSGIKELPGVGPYTLGAVASIAFGHPLPVVDGNVFRVLSRWIGIDRPLSKCREEIWGLAGELLPAEQPGDFNQAMMELGALVCTPINPSCAVCPIRKECHARKRGLQEKLPVVVRAPSIVHLTETVGWVIRGQKVLVCRRRKGGRMEGLWQFPSVLLSKGDGLREWRGQFGKFREAHEIWKDRYTVTRHRIQLKFYRMTGYGRQQVRGAVWMEMGRAKKLAFTSAHRKLADQFL